MIGVVNPRADHTTGIYQAFVGFGPCAVGHSKHRFCHALGRLVVSSWIPVSWIPVGGQSTRLGILLL